MNELEQRIREKNASVQEIVAASKKPEKPEKDEDKDKDKDGGRGGPDPKVRDWKDRPFGNAWDNFNQKPPAV